MKGGVELLVSAVGISVLKEEGVGGSEVDAMENTHQKRGGALEVLQVG